MFINGDIGWAELKCPSALGKRLLGSTHRHQVVRVPMVSPSIIWAQFEGSTKLPLNRGPVPVVVQLGKTQRGMGLGKSVVDGSCQAELRLGLAFDIASRGGI